MVCCPEGAEGFSPGFQPREPHLLNLVFSTERRMPFPQSAEVESDLYVLRPFRANRFIGCYPGLKPRAESCSPFGAKNHPKMPFYPRH